MAAPIVRLHSHLKIGPVDVPVFEVPSLDLHGFTADTPVPYIAVRNMDSTQGFWTLLHEAIHMISDQLHLGLKEREVRALDVGISSLIRDNPGLVTGLIRQLQASVSSDKDARKAVLAQLQRPGYLKTT